MKTIAKINTKTTNNTFVIVRIIEKMADSLIPIQLMVVVININAIASDFDV